MADNQKDTKSNANPIPGAVAAQMARGIPQRKAMAMTGLGESRVKGATK